MIYVLGSTGMMGRYLCSYFTQQGITFTPICRKDLDASDDSSINQFAIRLLQNDVVINVMGVTNKKMEGLSSEYVYAVNSWFPQMMAGHCADVKAKLYHVSTDCFTPDTNVLSEHGYKKICDVSIGDKVFTHQGVLRRVYDTKKRIVDDDVLMIKTLGGTPFECTTQHPLYVIRHVPHQSHKKFSPEWVLAQDVRVHDLIAVPKVKTPPCTVSCIDMSIYNSLYRSQIEEYQFFKNAVLNKKMNISEFCREHNLSYAKILRWRNGDKPRVIKYSHMLTLNKDVAWLLGVFVAEGWLDFKNKRVIITPGEDPVFIDRIISAIKNNLQVVPYVRRQHGQNSVEISFTHLWLWDLLRQDFYLSDKHYSWNKTTPHWLSLSGEDNIASFLSGYFMGDGCFYQKDTTCFFSVTSVSETLIDNIKLLLLILGVWSNKHAHAHKGVDRICGRSVIVHDQFSLQVAGKTLLKFSRLFNFKYTVPTNKKIYNQYFEDELYWYVPITEITKRKYYGEVYNLEVEIDHSYLIGGGLAVHNCVFRGIHGGYTERDKPSSSDLYGVSKRLGEPQNCAVIRTSILGEGESKEFLGWVLSHKDSKINGYTNHLWSGVTCLRLCQVLESCIKHNIYWYNVKHVFSQPTSKHDLVVYINTLYNLNNRVVQVKDKRDVDKTLTTIRKGVVFPIYNIYDDLQKQKEFKL